VIVAFLLGGTPEVTHQLMALVVHEFKDSPKSEDDTDGSSAVSMASREEVKFN